MNSFLFSDSPVLGLSLFALGLVLAVPLLFYGGLASGVWFEGKGRVRAEQFGFYDALAATGLILLFSTLVVGGLVSENSANSAVLPSGTAMVTGLVLSTSVELVLIAVIVGSLTWRGVPSRSLFGLDRIGLDTVLSRAALSLALALPLIYGALMLFHFLLAGTRGGENASQELVRFLALPGLGFAKVVLAFSAVCIAPVLEEFIFRGFIYGVVRQYAGPFIGLLVNATIFAGIHQNTPSFGGLFVLAACLTLAYEWTGSLYVPITMHALFNLLSVVSLLSGHNDG